MSEWAQAFERLITVLLGGFLGFALSQVFGRRR